MRLLEFRQTNLLFRQLWRRLIFLRQRRRLHVFLVLAPIATAACRRQRERHQKHSDCLPHHLPRSISKLAQPVYATPINMSFLAAHLAEAPLEWTRAARRLPIGRTYQSEPT